MCGRFALTLPPHAMRTLFGYVEQPNFPPRYNIAPTQPIAIITDSKGQRHFRLMRWGFIPSWVKDPTTFSLLINARAETAAEKPAFRAAMLRRRALVPASGFYEWRTIGSQKMPFYIERRDGDPLIFGALWETYMHADGSEVDTAALMTTTPNTLMQQIHTRMPVLIPPQAFEAWLDPATERRHLTAMLGPAPDDLLKATPVSPKVNSVRNEGADLINPLAEPLVVDRQANQTAEDSDAPPLFARNESSCDFRA